MSTPAAATKTDDISVGGLVAFLGVIGSGLAVTFGAMLIAPTIVDAYVVMKLWGWFVPSIFPALPILAYWQAAGLVLVVREIRPHYAEAEREHTGEIKHPWRDLLLRLTAYPAITLLIGLFVRHFI